MRTVHISFRTKHSQEINNRITSQGYRLFRFQELVKQVDHLIEESIASKWISYSTYGHSTESGKKRIAIQR